MAATFDESSKQPTVGSYQTALCVVPPKEIRERIDTLRSTCDKAYGRWPAHVNVIYPFVKPEDLPRAAELIRSRLAKHAREVQRVGTKLPLRFDVPGHFDHRYTRTVYLSPRSQNPDEATGSHATGSTGINSLKALRKLLLEPFTTSPPPDAQSYHPHLTVGQTKIEDISSFDQLLEKAGILLPFSWDVEDITILVREQRGSENDGPGKMNDWGRIDLAGSVVKLADESVADNISVNTNSRPTYRFSTDTEKWLPTEKYESVPEPATGVPALSLSSYNVLFDTDAPQDQERYALLVNNILSSSGVADIVVLQEVSDDFLSYLLRQASVRTRFPYTTHGPPEQDGLGPLPSVRNIVALSRWRFSWEYLPFKERHKGSAILKFMNIGFWDKAISQGLAAPPSSEVEPQFRPLIVSAVHLSSGVTNETLAAKKSQLQILVDYMYANYSENPWILAGDFNIATSGHTNSIENSGLSIASETLDKLHELEQILSGDVLRSIGLEDAWEVTRQKNDGPSGGEGDTFDPENNLLAGREIENRPGKSPQRYDRILIKQRSCLEVEDFNIFGMPLPEDLDTGHTQYASDHWGIRAALKVTPVLEMTEPVSFINPKFAIEVKKAVGKLSELDASDHLLQLNHPYQTVPLRKEREEILTLLEEILLQSTARATSETGSQADDVVDTRPIVLLKIVPVGSFGLGVWGADSDIDCLCVGSISTKTFFAVAAQRLRKSSDLGVKILRTVQAASGTMMELEIRGVKVDLQYCPATKVAEQWSTITKLDSSDPIFDLSILSLKKLNAFRDMSYIIKTVPDLSAFRSAHKAIRAWAESRGIYSSKFGYIGGIHITLMLSRVCKLIAPNARFVRVEDLVCTFFHYYANFDWQKDMVYDPTFNQETPRYRRLEREAMVILSVHSPVVNVAHTASALSVITLSEEIKHANDVLSSPNASWKTLVESFDFLAAFKSYIVIDVNYWGPSASKCRKLVGWLESRCILLLVAMNKRLPSIHARIWPGRWATKADIGDEKQFCTSLLIGVEAPQQEWKPDHLAAVKDVLERFSEQIRGDTQYYDPSATYVELRHSRREKFQHYTQDNRELTGTLSAEEELELEDLDIDSEDDVSDTEEDEESSFPGKKTKREKKFEKKNTKAKVPTKAAGGAKLRPSDDVIARIRWDPDIDSSDYVIGYEDRFIGVKEMPFDRWKMEKTDEEWIPQHRIAYFKRRSDGKIVWEKATRIDEIFKSGVSK